MWLQRALQGLPAGLVGDIANFGGGNGVEENGGKLFDSCTVRRAIEEQGMCEAGGDHNQYCNGVGLAGSGACNSYHAAGLELTATVAPKAGPEAAENAAALHAGRHAGAMEYVCRGPVGVEQLPITLLTLS